MGSYVIVHTGLLPLDCRLRQEMGAFWEPPSRRSQLPFCGASLHTRLVKGGGGDGPVPHACYSGWTCPSRRKPFQADGSDDLFLALVVLGDLVTVHYASA